MRKQFFGFFMLACLLAGIGAATKVNLVTQVVGILPVANGGFGAATASANAIFTGPAALDGTSGAPSFKNSYILFPYVPRPNTRRWAYSAERGDSATGDIVGCSTSGTVTHVAATTTDPPYQKSSTTAVAGNLRAAFDCDPGIPEIYFANNPWAQTKVKLFETTDVRYYVGLSDSNLDASTTDAPTGDFAVFRFSTSTAGVCSVGATGAVRASNVVTITCGASHGFNTGERVTIAGMTDSTFNVTAVILTRTGATTFTYANTGGNATTGNGTGTVVVDTTWRCLSRDNSTTVDSDSGVTPDTSPHTYDVQLTTGASVNFLIDAVQVCSISTHLPTSTVAAQMMYSVYTQIATAREIGKAYSYIETDF